MSTLICTMVIGNPHQADDRVAEVTKCVDSFKQYMGLNVAIITDQSVEDMPSDLVIPLSDIGTYRTKVQAAFNYNLKGIIMHYMYHNFKQYDRIIWVDCDVFITDWCVPLDDMWESDVYVRIGPFPGKFQAYEKYLKIMDIIFEKPVDYTELKYINEVLIVINRTPMSKIFLDNWFKYCVLSTMCWHINPCYEAVEVAIALQETQGLTVTDIPRYRQTHDAPHPTMFTKHRDEDLPHL